MTFKDTKEGAFGIRVARALDHPSKQAQTYVDAKGQMETVPRLDNTGVKGSYVGSDGKTGEDVWGTRGPWMGLTGVIDGQPVTVAILDHPSNHGHPTYWHARGYGLFNANPLGRQGYDPKQEPVSLTLQPGQSVTFRHRILVRDSKLTREELQKEYDRFAGERATGQHDGPIASRAAGSRTGEPPAFALPALRPGKPCPKCRRIFDGRSWEGWEHDPKNWFIVDGAMRGAGAGARSAFTKEDYGRDIFIEENPTENKLYTVK